MIYIKKYFVSKKSINAAKKLKKIYVVQLHTKEKRQMLSFL